MLNILKISIKEFKDCIRSKRIIFILIILALGLILGMVNGINSYNQWLDSYTDINSYEQSWRHESIRLLEAYIYMKRSGKQPQLWIYRL